jgi:hypothetical protein
MTAVRQAVSAIIRGTAADERAFETRQTSNSRFTGRNVTLAALALTMGFAGAASAQQAEGSGAGGESLSLDEVTVTGSRIRRTTDFDTANPTTVVDSDYLKI